MATMVLRVFLLLVLLTSYAEAADAVKLAHGETVRAAVFAIDGKHLYSSSLEAPSIRIWESASGKEVRTFPGPKGGASFLALSPDGTLLAAGGSSETVALFDPASGKEVRQLKGHEKVVTCAAFAPDGKTLATGSQDFTIRFWEVATGKELQQFTEEEAINAVAYAPDGKTLASAGWFPTVHLWDVASGKSLPPCVGHRGSVVCVAFSPDGRLLATGGEDRSIRVWEVISGKEIRQIEDHAEQVNALGFTPDGQALFSAAGDRTVRLWSIASGRELQRFDGHQGPVFVAALAPDGRRIASGGSDRTLIIRDIADALRPARDEIQELTAKQLEALWRGLASTNPRQAYRAVWTMNASPQQTLALFQERLEPLAATADRRRVDQLLKELNDERFPVREKAARDLESLGEVVEPFLEKALAGFLPSLEVRRRVERILEKVKEGKARGGSPDVLRALRAITILETLGTPESKRLLEKFADGMPEARMTQDAKAALDRTARRKEQR